MSNGIRPRRLADLEDQVREQVALTAYDAPAWAGLDDGTLPVVVVGAGQAGLSAAFGLRRKGIRDVLVIDAAAADATGPWASYARMHTLRTPKDALWPAWGVPAATPRAWFTATHGRAAWEELVQLPTSGWRDFLRWYREILEIEVSSGTSLTAIRPAAGALELELVDERGPRTVRAARVVLATGIEGAGGRRVPSLFDGLPAHRWSHIHDDIDFAGLRGLRVGILGGGTGAFDNAATALEAGAASVTVHMRRAAMPSVSPYRWMEFPGLLEHYPSFTDDQKWTFNEHLARVDQPATQGAIWRAYAHETFELRTSSPWLGVDLVGDDLVVRTPQGSETYDHLLAATGVSVDLAARPELVDLVDDIACWRDRYAPPSDTTAADLLGHPYLSDTFALTSRTGRLADALSRVYLFNHGARMSVGILGHQISGLSGGVERLVHGVVRDTFVERSESVLASYLTYAEPAGVVLGARAEAGVAHA
ncbi:MAG: SidA/IucD/PvdA family monooxygenase [Actinobacteria bacterium]|uniref:Unannotated protein n=1 Tax=freshwater metagenome TaxID=449393 RepID=A0A6J6Q0I2_9ZZZZ|nr:SidA/IucD/PvdA family monooxygenase [Actinomycetota bacterium]